MRTQLILYVLAEKIGSLDVVPADKNASDETPDPVELATDEQFLQEKQEWRKQSLYHTTLLPENKEQLIKILVEPHSILSLEEGERGETSLAQFAINTGDSANHFDFAL